MSSKAKPELTIKPTKLIKNPTELHVTVQVGVFLPQKPLIELFAVPGKSRVIDMKKELGKKLHFLMEGSIKLFGLFQGGSLGHPTLLLQNDDVLPEKYYENLFFQRLSFDEDAEAKFIFNDYRAMELIFWEIADQKCQLKIYPPLTNASSKILQELLNKKENPTSDTKDMEFMLNFLDLMYKKHFLYYWRFYYRSDNCVLKGPTITAATPHVTEGTRVRVALCIDTIVFLHSRSWEGFIADFPWCKVQAVSMDKLRKLVMFDILIENVPNELSSRILRKIPLETSDCQYIYTIACHILKIRLKNPRNVNKM